MRVEKPEKPQQRATEVTDSSLLWRRGDSQQHTVSGKTSLLLRQISVVVIVHPHKHVFEIGGGQVSLRAKKRTGRQ
jgi:hypothetical protein